MRLLTTLLLGCLLAASTLAQKIRYDGYKVLTVYPNNAEQLQVLVNTEDMEDLTVDFWTEPTSVQPQEILVSPGSLPRFQALITDSGMTFEVAIDNLQERIDIEEMEDERLRQEAVEAAGPDGVPSVLGRYARASEIDAWINNLPNTYPSCSTRSIGKSYEGRDVRMLTVSSGGSKPVIFIDAAVHAREWITPAVMTYMINQLLTTSAGKDLLARYDFLFVPMVNVDGYEYSHTRDRMWRKTRSPNAGSNCRGTDSNRNFDHSWGQAGASRNPCSQTYMGSAPFSEVESRNVRDAVLAVKSRIALYMNLHSYSQMWLTPLGDTTVRPPHGAENDRVAALACQAMSSTHGRRYRYGTSWQLLYRVSGACMDWAHSKGGAKYSTVIELRPASAGEGGFIIPASHIVPNGQEMWNGLVVSGREMKYP